ncbi:H-NS histone family protein [Pseudidiomarina andamanensis]|uniref:DNA-binding protein n=1 Tax=Pseudidiomarina andamanensis TaxID=1940690 RepID=A0AA92IL23_9GAMM|nr:H-NS family nucleoid-associated regulatory protein [Pseudidiomarina andamanensis]MDS0218141.1 H-NS histone family protein [Pseudidiomarina andamanensis]QGT95026.1 H-NS histone family protein [Pseudidiomarina andamanensis]
MSEFLKILNHGRRLKAAVKELSVTELEEVREKLNKVIEERKEEEAELKKLEVEKQRKIEEVKRFIDEAGIDLAELVGEPSVTAKVKTKRTPKPPKYEITDNDGNRVTWTGQGRMPKALKAAVDSGKSLEDFLI